jgi:hypothetical protein
MLYVRVLDDVVVIVTFPVPFPLGLEASTPATTAVRVRSAGVYITKFVFFFFATTANNQ